MMVLINVENVYESNFIFICDIFFLLIRNIGNFFILKKGVY